MAGYSHGHPAEVLRIISSMKTPTQIRRIGIEDVTRRRKDLIFVDVRSATSIGRNPVQVPGAIHVPVKELESRIKRLPHDRTLVTYCS